MATVPKSLMEVAQYSVWRARDACREAVPKLWQPTVPVLPGKGPTAAAGSVTLFSQSLKDD